MELGLWARQDGRGRVFEANAGFRLANGSVRSPDASWVSWARWNALSKTEQERFGPLCPEFVVESQSRSDRTKALQAKMMLWISQGAELAWLIDPQRRVVEIYRPETSPEVVEGASAVYGDGPVSGFLLELARIWGSRLAAQL